MLSSLGGEKGQKKLAEMMTNQMGLGDYDEE